MTDRLIRITTALAVVAVAVVAAIISYQHAYELVRSHGESGGDGPVAAVHGGRPDLGRVHGGAGRQPSEPACTVARRVEPGHRNRGHGRRQPGARRRPWPGRCVGQRVARLGLVPASGSGIRSSISANCRTISDSPRRISAKAPAVKPGNVLVSSTTYVQHSVSRRWYSAVPAAKDPGSHPGAPARMWRRK